MTSLSPVSLRFIKSARSTSSADNADGENYGQAYTQLFCELYDILREVKASLETKGLGPWTLTYGGTELHQTLSFAFRLNQDHKGASIDLNFKINPSDQSSLEVNSNISSDQLNSHALAVFLSSPAYRRYFAPYESEASLLKTQISARQLGSRHFGGYLQHLCEMAMPLLTCLREAAPPKKLTAA